MQTPAVSAIWPSTFIQNVSDVQGLSPIPFIWIIGAYKTGKSTFIATVDPVRPGTPTRTLVTDLEMSQETIATQAPIDLLDIRKITREKIGKDYTFKDLFEVWRDEILAIQPGQYTVLGVDPVSDLYQGAFMYVGAHPELFGKTAQRYSGEMGIKAQWGDTALYWKQLALELAQRFQTTVFVSHIKDVYNNNVKTGQKAARGADFMEIATLVLWLDRTPEGKHWAMVKKSRLTWWDWGKPEDKRTRPILRELLPVRLEPEYAGQPYPELIAGYMAAPQADYGDLNTVEHDPSIQVISADEQAQIDLNKAEADAQVALNTARNAFIQDLISNGHYPNAAAIAKAVAVLGEKFTIEGRDELFAKLVAHAQS